MPIIIATCNDIAEFGANRLADRHWSSRFLGTGWITELYARADSLGWIVASGDVVLENVQAGRWNAADVLVVQELGARQGRHLIDLGAMPLLLTCMESPIYAPLFYDRLQHWQSTFSYVMVPGPCGLGNSEKLRFPCYWEDERRASPNWSGRKSTMLMAGNKYWSARPALPRDSLRRLLSSLRQRMRLTRSETWRDAARMQLHDDRFSAVAALSREGMLDIYGAGWTDLSHIPTPWQQALDDAGLRVFGAVDDKLSLQAGYKFALAFENATYPGYVTEKIVQCLVTGTIPVYLGAPDIAEFIPLGAYVDARALPSLDALPACLRSIGEDAAARMLRAGHDFLQTPEGRMHSYEGFADWFVGKVKEWCNDHRP